MELCCKYEVLLQILDRNFWNLKSENTKQTNKICLLISKLIMHNPSIHNQSNKTASAQIYITLWFYPPTARQT